MQTNTYLFPHRLTRRDFLKLGTAAAVGLAVPGSAPAEAPRAPVRIGSGHFTYTLDEGWGRLPAGMHYGFGCGVVLDGRERVYVTSRSANPCVAVFDRDGTLLETWSDHFAEEVGYSTAQVADTAHCLYWSREGNEEFIYWTENISTNRQGPRVGARVYKTDLQGKILYQIGRVAREGSTSQTFDWTNPTDVAVAPSGDIYVVDGYGSQRVSHFDRNFRHIRTIGARTASNALGPDAPHGTFNTCHGAWVCTLRDEPEVYIADRHNERIEVFDLDLNYKRTLKGDLDFHRTGRGMVRNPCCFYQHQGHLYIPDLASRVTILDGDDQVAAQLGDGLAVPRGGMGVKPEVADRHPDKFFAPHAMTVDSRGDFYVVEWVAFGRPRKFRHTPAV